MTLERGGATWLLIPLVVTSFFLSSFLPHCQHFTSQCRHFRSATLEEVQKDGAPLPSVGSPKPDDSGDQVSSKCGRHGLAINCRFFSMLISIELPGVATSNLVYLTPSTYILPQEMFVNPSPMPPRTGLLG